MLRTVRVLLSEMTQRQTVRAGALLLLTSSIAGCSADIGRLDFSGIGPGESRTSTASVPLPSAPMRRNVGAPIDTIDEDAGPPPRPYYGRDPATGRAESSRQPSGRTAGFSEPTRDLLPPPTTTSDTRSARRPAMPVASSPPPASPDSLVEVRSGDTLYGIARQHKVSVSELMAINGLQGPTIRPGQKLRLPSGRRSIAHRTAVRTQKIAIPATPPKGPDPVADKPATTVSWTGTHTIAAGESIYRIARRHHVTSAQLQAANGITDPTKLRVGMVIKVPGSPEGAPPPIASAPPPPPAPQTRSEPPVDAAATAAKVGGGQFTILNQPRAETPEEKPRQVAELGPAATGTRTDIVSDASPAGEAGTGKFRWPVKGRIIAGFGKRSDNTQNDGINISVPPGTDVHAAESGEVAYAGDDLKGYGNLILIRHPGNWVSAYAHNEQILVKRGDKIKRGQPIAKAGKTGAVDQPQVHFELRQGSKPVDPLPYLDKQ